MTQRPAPLGICQFPTALGDCGMAWTDAGIVAVQLPEADVAGTLARMLAGLGRPRPDSADLLRVQPPPSVVAAMQGVQALMQGAPRDLCELQLDLRGVPDFACRVYGLTRAIAPGHTRTYGELARALGDVHLSRAVGQALGANPFAPVVPCHRVLAAGDRAGGFSAYGGAQQKLRMLATEGACPGGTLPLF